MSVAMSKRDVRRPSVAMWALVAGLALGFATGREVGSVERRGCGLASFGEAAETSPAPSGAAPEAPSEAEPAVTAVRPPPQIEPPPIAPLPPSDGPWLPLSRHNARRGTTGAKGTIVEFVDFSSPECKAVAPLLHRVRDRFPSDVAVVVFHLPDATRPEARSAALAMQAALRQRKHWEMHDRMLEGQPALARADLLGYATELGLDVESFARDLDDPSVAAEVDADGAIAARIGAVRAPAFYVNCAKLDAPYDLDAFARIIEPQIAAANAQVVAGVTLEGLYDVLCKAP
jgi:predicted DsbA family dithiol-disulfide isomerase